MHCRYVMEAAQQACMLTHQDPSYQNLLISAVERTSSGQQSILAVDPGAGSQRAADLIDPLQHGRALRGRHDVGQRAANR